jgi:hypothetical protein
VPTSPWPSNVPNVVPGRSPFADASRAAGFVFSEGGAIPTPIKAEARIATRNARGMRVTVFSSFHEA